MLKEVLPRLTRVAMLPSPSGTGQALKEMQAAASSLKMQRVFEAATKARAGALIGMPDATGVLFANMGQISTLAVKKKLATMFPSRRYVDAGGLMSYSADDLARWHRAAMFVDKILKGTKPADLPVEQPMKFEFVINLKAAKQIGYHSAKCSSQSGSSNQIAVRGKA